MIIDTDVVTLSRLQFALTALYHFLFVPLTLGLVWMLAIMESVYLMTGREVWKRMVQFWGVLFGINFAMGVATDSIMGAQTACGISPGYSDSDWRAPSPSSMRCGTSCTPPT